jgi:hypothetical protein
MDGISKWYYCTPLKRDPFNGFSKTITIVPKSKDKYISSVWLFSVKKWGLKKV